MRAIHKVFEKSGLVYECGSRYVYQNSVRFHQLKLVTAYEVACLLV